MLMLAFKELFQAMLSWFFLKQNKVLPGALLAGKVSTAVIFTSLGLLICLPKQADTILQVAVPGNLLFLTVSLLEYTFVFLGKNDKLMDLRKE